MRHERGSVLGQLQRAYQTGNFYRESADSHKGDAHTQAIQLRCAVDEMLGEIEDIVESMTGERIFDSTNNPEDFEDWHDVPNWAR